MLSLYVKEMPYKNGKIYINMSTNKQIKLKKGTVKAILNTISVILYTLLYFLTIFIFYHNNTEYDYGPRGYIVLLTFYLFILISFLNTFGSFKLGNKRIIDITLSNIMALFFTDFVAYFVFSLIEGHLALIWPHLGMLAIQLLFGIIFAYRGSQIVRFRFPPEKALLIHGNENYKDIVNKLKKYQKYEFDIVKNVSEEKLDYKNIESILNKYECVITVEVNHENKKNIVKKCYENNLHVYDVPSIVDVFIKSGEVTNFIDTPLFRINRMGPSQLEKIIKRLIDLFGSIVLLIIGSPFMLVTALVIKLQDGGDVFFRQKRLTIDGREFYLIKFRSMIMNAEPEGKAIRAKVNDSRITPFGKFIRSTRIDELPQVFNILTGDLSFVGPRALRVEEYEQNEKNFPEFKYRTKVQAGLTGYAQVYGKYNTTFRDKLLLDIYYIENYSIITDIKLILMTFATMFTKDSTEGF